MVVAVQEALVVFYTVALKGKAAAPLVTATAQQSSATWYWALSWLDLRHVAFGRRAAVTLTPPPPPLLVGRVLKDKRYRETLFASFLDKYSGEWSISEEMHSPSRFCLRIIRLSRLSTSTSPTASMVAKLQTRFWFTKQTHSSTGTCCSHVLSLAMRRLRQGPSPLLRLHVLCGR